MFCSKCGEKLSGESICPKCGAEVSASTEEAKNQTQGPTNITLTIPPIKTPDQDQLKRFLNFETMITPAIMKVLYIIGSVIIILSALWAIFAIGGAGGFFSGLIGGIIGLVVFRIVCEQMILFFSIHHELNEIKNRSNIQ